MRRHLTPIRMSPVRATFSADVDHDELLRHCSALAYRPERIRLTLGMLCARFVACAGPHWLGCFNQAQYAADHLGMSAASFRDAVAVGHLLQEVPEATAFIRARQLSYSSLVQLARLGRAEAARTLMSAVAGLPVSAVEVLVSRHLREQLAPTGPGGADLPEEAAGRPAATTGAPARTPKLPAGTTGPTAGPQPGDPGGPRLAPHEEDALVSFAIPVPAPVAVYVRATLDAAQLLLGHDAPPDQQLEAVVAEASTEVVVNVSAEAACRRFGVRWPLPPSQPIRIGARRSPSIAAARPAGSGDSAGLTAPAASIRGPAAWQLDRGDRSRRAAFILHRAAVRQARRLATAQADLEDGVLRLVEADAPRALGLPTIDAFAQQALGLAPRTVYDFLNRARRRRRDDPVATACAQGRIGDVQADLLEHLVRRVGVSRAALGPWIEAAERVTVRGLRDCVRWARGQADSDYRAWALAGFPVPNAAQLRTSARQLARCLADATPPDPVALIAARHTPQVRLELIARTATLAALLQLMASRQDAAVRQYERETGAPGQRPPVWWAVLSVFALARHDWTQHAAANVHTTHAILDRDAYRCAASGCTSRRRLEAHHIHYKGRQGPDSPDNLAALCATHHRLGEHGGILRVRGAAVPDASALIWELGLDPQGRPQMVCRGDEVRFRATPRRRDPACPAR